jgi:RNA polymerase sigma factor (sigma-70 family)
VNRLPAQELSAARKAQNYRLLWEQAIPVVKFAISRLIQSGRVERTSCSDDMYQAAYLAVGASVRSWEPDKVAFSTWIVTRAQGAALDYLRYQASGMVGGRDADGRTGMYDEELTPDHLSSGVAESVENDEQTRELLNGWQQLDRYDKDLLGRRFGLDGFESMSIDELTASNGEPRRTTQRRLQNASKKVGAVS